MATVASSRGAGHRAAQDNVHPISDDNALHLRRLLYGQRRRSPIVSGETLADWVSPGPAHLHPRSTFLR